MSYANIESALASILATVTNLSSSTVTLDDEGVLDKGITHAAIISMGAASTTPIRGRTANNTYTAKVALYVRYTTKAAAHSALLTLRDNVIAKLQKYFPDVNNDGVSNYMFSVESITTEGDPTDILMRNNPETGPVFRAQTLIIAVSEIAII